MLVFWTDYREAGMFICSTPFTFSLTRLIVVFLNKRRASKLDTQVGLHQPVTVGRRASLQFVVYYLHLITRAHDRMTLLKRFWNQLYFNERYALTYSASHSKGRVISSRFLLE
jgi:hypothetical protein